MKRDYKQHEVHKTELNNKKKLSGSNLLSRHKVSIIGVRELDFRVRDGNGYSLSTMATGQFNTFVQSYPVSDKRIGTRYNKVKKRRK